MVAVFTGNGLGLFGAGWGNAGTSSAGQGADRQYINLANGNLVLQAQDEQVLYRGLGIAQVRTYNSLGQSSQVGADGWVTGFERRMELIQGTLNQAGSVMRRYTGDGGYQDFTYQSANTYRATSGDGAHDLLSWSATNSTWTYTEGSTRATEIYASHADSTLRGRLMELRDPKGDATQPKSWLVDYDAQGRVTAVRDVQSKSALQFAYDANGRLQQVTAQDGATVAGRVSYGYDSLGRLSWSLVDLTPANTADASTWNTSGGNDNLLYRTDYAYDGNTLRITQVKQSDGTLLTFAYDAQGRVSTAKFGDDQPITYTYDTANRRTDVTDVDGQTWSYSFDASGQLTQTQSPPQSGQRNVTSYTYDADGNLSSAVSQRGSAVLARTDYQYDANGNVLWQWMRATDTGAARAVQRTYTASNQLASETIFTGLDADGAGSASQPSGGATTQYIYDAQDRLRFVLNAAAEVRELSYYGSGDNGVGQVAREMTYAGVAYSGNVDLASLQTWANTQATSRVGMVEYRYDSWGRLSERRGYATVDALGNGVVDNAAQIQTFSYNAQGWLLATAVARGDGATRNLSEQTQFSYDGMGRKLSETTRASDGTVLSTSVWAYLDSGMGIRLTRGTSGNQKLTTTELRDRSGRLVSITATDGAGTTSRTSRMYYDDSGRLRASEDAAGGRTYFFYDNLGQLSAQVDAIGAAVAYARDGLGRVVTTTAYANRLDTSAWLVAGAVSVEDWTALMPTANASDRVQSNTYDIGGLLVLTVDAEGAKSRFEYDGAGHLVRTVATNAAEDAATARTQRLFYDAAGRAIATLDAAGYLTERFYDGAGRLVGSRAYATASTESLRANGTLAQLRPQNNAADQASRIFYDGAGRAVGVLDAEGYLTESVYDDAHNQRASRAYAPRLDALTGTETFQTLVLRASQGSVRETRMSYDAAGRLVTQVNAEGTVTQYKYDDLGRQVSMQVAVGTSEVREGRYLYDSFGNLIGELSGNGATHLLPNMTEAQLDTLYAQYGTRHSYDPTGRRLESIDAQGNKTWYFYDTAGHLTHTVRGVANAQSVANGAGEVTELRYDAFGQVIDSITYTGTLTIATPGSRASVATAITTLQYLAGRDLRIQSTYDRRGALTTRLDALGNRQRFEYNAFGDNTAQIIELGSGVERSTRSDYDARGLRLTLTSGNAGLQVVERWQYDAFGRATQHTDARGQVQYASYDRNGRQVAEWQTVNGVEQRTGRSYDAFGRVLTETDAEGGVTTYTYDDPNRALTVRTQEGVVVRTVHNRHGQTLSVTDSAGRSTSYEYDASGNQTAVVAADGSRQTQEYDSRELLTRSTDAAGRVVTYAYDAAGRVLTRSVDPSGLNQVTRYAYDAVGRQISVTDAVGTITTQKYDANGRLLETVVNPGGVAFTTQYTWDAAGQQLSVTTGAGTADARTVGYAYDVLGRRISETVDPGTGKLNLLTRYEYDANGNVTARVDPAGRVTRYTYDAADRLEYTVDGAGGVTRNWYDRDGRTIGTRAYAAAISLTGLNNSVTSAQIAALITANDARDLQTYSVYDGDGRLRLSLDGAGAVSGVDYDALGRVVRTIRYANAASLSSLRASLLNGSATTASVIAGVTFDTAREQVSWRVLDSRGRVHYEIAGDGAVVEYRYDATGLVTGTFAYANRLTLSAQDRLNLTAGTVTEATLAARISTSAQDQAGYKVYDAAGRLRYAVQRDADGNGRATRYRYDGVGSLISTEVFGEAIAYNPLHTLAALDTAVTGKAVRTTQVVYDAAGRQRFVVDASGAVTELRYNAAGENNYRLVYAVRPDGSVQLTLAGLKTWAAAVPAAQQRVTRQDYDAAGRVKQRFDALNQKEIFEYDGAGQLIRYTDVANQVWTYGYDNAGRSTSETSPQVSVATLNASGQVVVATRAIVTRTTYDALGQVTSRSEDADGATPRITDYQYDNRGNQTRTTFPDPWVIDEASGLLVASNQRPTVDVVYDVLNRAVVQKDARGYYSYKVYDVTGQLAYDIDAEGFVTAYAYDAFGQQTSLRRHALALQTASITGWSAGQPLTQAQVRDSGAVRTDAADRQMISRYNSLGQKVETQSSQRAYYDSLGNSAQGTPTVRYQYDGYAQLLKVSELLTGSADGSDAKWADTWYYYDALGRGVFTVDAEGYATTTEYVVTGEVAAVTEHARALSTQGLGAQRPATPAAGDAVTGFDRLTRYGYDALGRKTSETATRRFQRADGTAGQQDVQTTFGYDALGHLTDSNDGNGVTRTGYDALGRVVSLREPERNVLRDDAGTQLGSTPSTSLTSAGLYALVSPYTTTVYDAFGNAVQIRRYANGMASGQSTATQDDTRDQVQTFLYDRQGRAVKVVDSLGNARTTAYDAAGNIVRMRYALDGSDVARNVFVVSTYTYDKAGRQKTLLQQRTGAQGTSSDLSESVDYNSFGEVTRKTHGGISGELLYAYDNGGNLVSANEDGGTVQMGYNLAGHQVWQKRQVWVNATQGNIDSITRTTTDRLGRATQVQLPSYNDATSTASAITRSYDRWGNVVQIIDARGYQTNYQYNSFNQVTRDERPLVEVVSETGARTWQRPVNEWFYDVYGRLVATRDANGHMRTNEYDAAGQLVKGRDAMGSNTLYAYDALGNQRLQQNALGYITFKQYDRLGRISAIGDYLLNDAGTARYATTLQSYVLDQNGDRLKVSDALGFTALYDYDSRQLMVRSQTAMGVTQQYQYDALGRKVTESNALSAGTFTDRDGQTLRNNELTWIYDVYGRTTDHNDLSGRDANYDYATGGQLTRETDAGGSLAAGGKSYQYYSNGQLKRVTEDNGNFYYYEYDAAGNRTLEEVSTKDGGGQVVHTYTRSWYDSQNRLQRVVQDDASSGPARRMFDISYDYDAVGNRRRVLAQSSFGPNGAAMAATNTVPVVIRSVADRTVRKGITSEFRVLFSEVFRDAEQDGLTLDITQANGSALPDWLSARFDSASGEIIFTTTPVAGSADADVAVKLIVRETANSANTVATVFTVRSRTNTAPRLRDSSVAQLSAKSGRPWSTEIAPSSYFIDDDVGDALTLSVDNAASLPTWLRVDLSNPYVLRLSGTPTGTTSVTLYVRATDQNGATVLKTVQLQTAPNAGPNVISTPTPTEVIRARNFNWSKPLSSLFADPNGDALQVKASGLPTWLNFTVLDGANPTLRLDGDVPSTEVDGKVYTVTFTATDPDGLSSTVSLQLTVRANRAPVVLNPSGFQLQGIRVNDRLDTTIAISGLFGDLEGDRVSGEVLNLPSWMTATIDQAAGTIRFTGQPTQAAHAKTWQFSVRGTDIAGLQSTAAVSIVVGQDRAPSRNGSVAMNDLSLSIGRNFSFTLPSDLFIEQDGDGFSMSLSVVTESSYIEDTIPPTTVWETQYAALPSWMTYNSTTRTVSGQVPAGTPTGSFVLRVSATDGRGNRSAEPTRIGAAGIGTDVDFKISVVPFQNSAPVYNGTLPARTLNHGTAVDWQLPAGAFTEPDGDTLTYSAQVQLPDSSFAALSSIGLSINSTTGRITGTPTNLAYLNFNIVIRATDPQSATASGYFAISVANAGPRPPSIPTRTATAGTAWTYQFPAFTDANNDVLTYTVTGMPGWMSFNASTRTLSGTPTGSGSWTLTVTARDPAGATSSVSFAVTTPNAAPIVVNAIPQQWFWRNAGASYQIPANTFSDANQDSLTYSASGLPAGLTFNASTRQISGSPTTIGNYVVTITASDGLGGNTSTSFTISVINVAPTYNGGLPNRASLQGEQVNWSLPGGTFSDANSDGLSYSIMVLRPAYWEVYWEPSEAAYMTRDIPAAWIPATTLSINTSTGQITGTVPIFVYNDTWYSNVQVKVVASDGMATAEGQFTASINFAPKGSFANKTIKNNVATSFQISAFTDSNGDALSYSMSGLPSGLSFDPGSRTVSGATGQSGAFTISVSVSDGRGGVTNASFVLTVQANNGPSVPGVGTMSMQVGTGVGVALPEGSDPDWDGLSYSIGNLPPGLWFDANSRTIGGTPTAAGSWGVTYYANDGRGGVGSTYFVINVAAAPVPNRAPYVNRQPASPAYFFYSTNAYVVSPETLVLPADTFVDPDNNPLRYEIIKKPSFLQFSYNSSGLYFTGVNNDTRPSATHDIIIRAYDTSNAWVDVSFYVFSQYEKVGPGGGVLNSVPGGDVASLDASTDADPSEQLSMAAADAVEPPTLAETSQANESLSEGSGELAGLAASSELMSAGGGAAALSAGAMLVTGWTGPVQIAPGTPPSNLGSTSIASGTGNVPVEVKEYWYSYDAENRIAVNNGKLENGQIVTVFYGEDSYALAYDAVGNVVSRTSMRGTNTYWIDRSSYDLRGNRVIEYYTDVLKNGVYTVGGGINKKMRYDAAGHLVESRGYYASGSHWDDETGAGQQYEYYGTYYYGGWLYNAQTYAYDGDGRVLLQTNLYRPVTTSYSWVKTADNTNGRQATDLAALSWENGTEYKTAAGASGYDNVGRLTTYRFITSQYTHTYTATYVGTESWLQKTVSGTSTNTNYKPTTNTITYDEYGRLMSQRETTSLKSGSIDDRMRYYGYDADGKVISRREGTLNGSGVFQQDSTYGAPNYRLVQAGGQQIAELVQGFKGVVNGSNYTKQQILSLAGTSGTYGAGGGQATAQAGDTLKDVSKRVYGTDQLWYVLAEANGFGDPDKEIGAGTQLLVPEATVNRNDASTFKPYDPASAVGSTTPGLPYIPPPPAGGGCQVMQIVAIIVAVVVTIYTAGAASGVMSAMVANAVGAAAGSIASQAVLMAGGLQSGFDWKAVGMAAVGGALTAGVAKIGNPTAGAASAAGTSGTTTGVSAATTATGSGATAFWKEVGRAALGNAATQGVAVVTGMQKKFDWRSVAASAVAAGVGYGFETKVAGSLKKSGWSDTTIDFAGGMARGVSSAAVRKDIDGKSLAFIAADSLGGAVGRRMNSARAERSAEQQAEQAGYEGVWEDGNPFNDRVEERSKATPDEEQSIYRRADAQGHSGQPEASLKNTPVSIADAARPASTSQGSQTPIADEDFVDEATGGATPEQQAWVKQVIDYAKQAGIAGPDSGDFVSVKAYYDAGYKNPISLQPIQVRPEPSVEDFAGASVRTPRNYLDGKGLFDMGVSISQQFGQLAEMGTAFPLYARIAATRSGILGTAEYLSAVGKVSSQSNILSFIFSAKGGEGAINIIDLTKLQPVLKTAGESLQVLALASEAVGAAYDFDKKEFRVPSAADAGHLGMSMAMAKVSTMGVPGLAVGGIWTVADAYVQTQHYTPVADGTAFMTSYKAGETVDGWSVYRAMANDNDHFGALTTMKSNRAMRYDEALEAYKLREMIRRYESSSDR